MHVQTRGPTALALALTTLLLSACGGNDDGGAPPPVQAAQPLGCAQLAGTTIPSSSIALPTGGAMVTAATVSAASGTGAAALPERCVVTASIAPVDPAAPPILMKVVLPTVWNSKALMMGGGGFDGSIPNVEGNVPAGPIDQLTPVGRGYATFASDSGHQANALGSQDGRWGANDEAVRNFGGDALKKTHDVALYLIRLRYAAGAPVKSYFAGGSTGGREALASIQRWPADWDGAIAWYPAWNDASALLYAVRLTRALAQPGAYPNPAKRNLLKQAALQACDGLDGAADGIIGNQPRCNAIFDPATAVYNGVALRCAGGADTGDTCLSDAQITALRVYTTPARFNFPLASGETGYPGFNVYGSDLGITANATALTPTIVFLGLGTSQPTNPMPTTAPYASLLVDQWVKYSVTRDPSFNTLTLDPENPGPYASRISQLSAQLDTSTDLSAFRARGGKLLLAHGTSDVLVSTQATELYYQRLQSQFGATSVDGFVRYYEVPGYGHGVGSAFNAAWDSLTALEQWSERSVAPTAQVVTDSFVVPGRTRPLCDYPKWPQYRGTGSLNAAASFSCVD